MCYEETDQVPLPPGQAVPVAAAAIELSTEDGNTFPAHRAIPERATGRPIVLLPDAGGLDPFYRELAERFAGLGHPTVAIDYFGRTAPSDERGDGFDHRQHQVHLTREQMLLDVRAGVEAVPGTPVVLGFCLGGATALNAGTTDLDIAGVVSFYPYHGGYGPLPALPDDFVAASRHPVLGLFGGDDKHVPVSVPKVFDEHLDRSGVWHDIVTYDGAPHGFFELHYLDRELRPELVDDVWRRLTDFLAR